VEAKRVLLHLKTCPAGNNGFSCPSDYNGCHQSRKLLAHYQKCREVRAKQAGMGRRTQTVHHVCLVCSLVARHAKSVLEGSSRKSNSKKQVIASFTLAEPGPPVICRQTSGATMPPPPPRQPCIVPAIPSWRNLSNSDSSSDEGLPVETPPSTNQLMMFSEVVAAATPPSSDSPDYSAALGKSLDSGKNQFLTFAASALQNLKRAPPTEELPGGLTSPRRSRAESYDERALKQFQSPIRDNHHHHHQQQPNALGNWISKVNNRLMLCRRRKIVYLSIDVVAVLLSACWLLHVSLGMDVTLLWRRNVPEKDAQWTKICLFPWRSTVYDETRCLRILRRSG
jgi:hypothetical protein